MKADPIVGKLYYPGKLIRGYNMDIINDDNIVVNGVVLKKEDILLCVSDTCTASFVPDVSYKAEPGFGPAGGRTIYFEGFIFLLGEKKIHIASEEVGFLERLDQ